MCTVSMVSEHYEDAFRKYIPTWPQLPTPHIPEGAPAWVTEPTWVTELRAMIADFRKAMEAAKVVDALTKQPDCIDPEKAKLQEHVARLERVIDALTSQPKPVGE